MTELSVSPIEAAHTLFAGEDLPFPPLSAEERQSLRQTDDHLFAIGSPPAPPYPLGMHVEEVLLRTAPTYVVLGFDGGGIASSAMHYYTVDRSLAVFVQIAWGGAYTDSGAAAELMKAVFEWVGSLRGRMARLVEKNAWPKGWRLLVKLSQFESSGWVFVPPFGRGSEEPELNGSATLYSDIDQALDDIEAGTLKLT